VEIGKIVAHYRKQKGLTQVQLAELVYTNNEHVNRIENGRRNPSIPMLQGIADTLGIPIWAFFYGEASAAAIEILFMLEDCTEGERAELCADLAAIKENKRRYHHENLTREGKRNYFTKIEPAFPASRECRFYHLYTQKERRL